MGCKRNKGRRKILSSKGSRSTPDQVHIVWVTSFEFHTESMIEVKAVFSLSSAVGAGILCCSRES